MRSKLILTILVLTVAFGPSIPISAQTGSHSITIYWTLNSANASYNLYRGSTSGSETKYKTGLIATTPNGCPTALGSPCGIYNDTGLNAGVTLYYTMTGVNSSGTESAQSAETFCTTLADAPVTPGVSCKAN